MKYIECKAQWFSRPMTTKTAMTGFEGPASKTELDDGFGVPTMKGMLTPSYSCYFEETGRVNNSPIYDGTINIPDTKANRYKIAQHIRNRDLRVTDRSLERQILADNPPLPRTQAPQQHSLIAEMPDDFDGSKVVLRSGNAAIVDADPIEDPHAQVSDGQFTEVKPEPKPVETEPKPAVAALSLAQVKAGEVREQAKAAPVGIDPRALKERSKAAAQE